MDSNAHILTVTFYSAKESNKCLIHSPPNKLIIGNNRPMH